MKKIWARVGITVEVPDNKYNELKKRCKSNNNDCLTEEEAEYFRKNGFIDGESYIPENCWDNYEWAVPEEDLPKSEPLPDDLPLLLL